MADFSSPFAQLQTGAPDPGKMLGLIGQINALKDFQAKQAVGEAFQQATDPATGLTDNGKFMGLVRQNPAAALRAPEAGANSAALTGQYISNATNQFGLNAGQTKFLADLAGSFIGKKGGATDTDLATARTIAARNGIPLALTEGILAGGPGDTRTPQQRFQDLQDFAMGPSGRASPQTTGVDQQGNPVTGTAGQALRQATPGAPPAPTAPSMAPVRNSNVFAPGETILPANSGPPGIVTALQPATQRKMEASSSQMGQDAQAASDYRNRIQPLESVIPLLEKLGPRGTGIGSELKAQLAKIGVTFGAGDSDAKIYDETRKYMLQDAMRNGEIGTNDKLVATTSSNPNMDLVQGANVDLAKAALAQRRIKQVQILEAQRQGVNPGQYQDWATQWNTSQDPRAYIVDHMTPKVRNQLLDQVEANLKSNDPNAVTQAKQFLESYKTARRFPGVMDLTKLQSGK